MNTRENAGVLCLATTIAALGFVSGCELNHVDDRVPQPIGGLEPLLIGQEIKLNSGEVWTIQKGEIVEFNLKELKYVKNLTEVTARVSFKVTAGGKGVEVVDGMIRYELDSSETSIVFRPGVGGDFHDRTKLKLVFKDFVPITVKRFGD